MNDDLTIIPVPPLRAAAPPASAVLDPGPRPYTVTDMIAGIVAVALLEVVLGRAVAGSTSAGWGVLVSLGTFLVFVSIVGLRLRAGIGRWLGARKLARTNLELASMGDDTITAEELCESVLCLRRCTADDASPLRRLDMDQMQEHTDAELPRVWIVSENGRVPVPGDTWKSREDEQGRRLVPCTVVRESLGRQSSTFAVLRAGVILLLAALMIIVIVISGLAVLGCAIAAVLFFIIAGLIPMRRIAFADRVLATTPEGVWLVLNEAARKKRDTVLKKRAKDLGVQVSDLPDDDRFVRMLPRLEIRVPWRECFVVMYRPKVTNTDDKLRPGSAWRWRIYPPRAYWDALGVGGTFAIEADGVDGGATPWGGVV